MGPQKNSKADIVALALIAILTCLLIYWTFDILTA